MNPRTKFCEGETVTTRAYISMFRKFGEEFKFAIDGYDDLEEVRAHLSVTGGDTNIGVTAFNEQEKFERIARGVEEMGLSVETEAKCEEDEELGQYTAYIMDAKATANIDADWNVPHLVVYGSLTPEIEECIRAEFRNAVESCNVRNHYVLFGETVDEDTKTNLADAIGRSNSFFEDDKRSFLSDVHTADLV